MGLYNNIVGNKMYTVYFLVGVGMLVLAFYLFGIKETVTENGVEKRKDIYPVLGGLSSIVGVVMILYYGATLYTGRRPL